MPHLARILTDPEERMRAKFIVKHAAAVARLDKVDFSRRLATLVTHITARNMETQAVCSLADFGFGVSQCLPIFIQGAMHFPGQLLVVEQPEAQLHPTAQLEMGSFFAELWNDKKVPSLIETQCKYPSAVAQTHFERRSESRRYIGGILHLGWYCGEERRSTYGRCR
jgi:hypothetical protein